MTDQRPAEAPPPLRRWWRRRWVIGVAAVVVLMIAVRAALPIALRALLVSRGNALLQGHVEVADVDLWLLRGAIAVDGFALRPERVAPPGAAQAGAATPDAAAGGAATATAPAAPAADGSAAVSGPAAPAADGSATATTSAAPPGAAGGTAERAPRVAFGRLYVDIRWLPLFARTVQFDEIALDGPELEVERLADGAIALPRLRPTDPEPGPGPEPDDDEHRTPWNVVVGAARLRNGKLVLVDHVAAPPETVALALDGLELLGFRLLHGGDEDPGQGTIEARFGDGTLRLSTSLATRAEGFAVAATVELDNLPLDRLNVHAPESGWRDLRGRLDGKLELKAEPGAVPVLSGAVALRDVQVDVPGEAEPALAWRRLDIEVERLDLERREALLRRVALAGAVVLLRPREPGPVPVLPRPIEPTAPDPARPAAAAADSPATEPWSWRIATVEIDDALAKVFLEPPPLEVGIVSARIDGLSSAPGSRASATVELREGSGTLSIAGDFAITPPAANLSLTLNALALERFAAAAAVTPPVLRRASLGGDLEIALASGTATVSGKVAVTDLEVAPAEGDDFRVTWQRLDVSLREARIPGLPPTAGLDAAPLRVDLARVALTAPKVRLTRTAAGIVLPGAETSAPETTADSSKPSPGAVAGADGDGAALSSDAVDGSHGPGASAAPGAASTPRPPPAAAVATSAPAPASVAPQIDVAELIVDAGELEVLDRTVQPFYRGRLSAIELDARGLAHPANTFADVRLTAQAPGGAPLQVRARQKGGTIDIEAAAERLALPPLNPYVTGAAGYSIASGSFTVAAKLRWAEDGYRSESSLAFDDLEVAGAEGDSLFAQRFGMPLSLALALLRDVSGRIALTVPVSGDRAGGVRPDLAPIVTEALARALLNALASPLKLIGALALDGNKVTAFAPEPIAFQPGRGAIADDAWWRVEQLANVLAAAPALRVELAGDAGPTDVRALQEAAVLADLEADQGLVATLRNLPSRGERGRIRAALTARAAGAPAELEPDDAATLEEWIAAKSVTDDELRALAAARQERLRDVLAADYGVAADRIVLSDAAGDRAAGTTVVRVAIGARG